MEDIETLLQCPCDNWLAYRNKALIHLLFDTGMRIGEALGLLCGHVDHTRRLVYIPPGKDGEARIAPFTPSCSQSINDYLIARPLSAHDRWLFVGGKGRGIVGPLTDDGCRGALRRWYQAAGVPYINPHSIRHLFATRALNNGIRAEIVSRILGHHSVDLTLSVYAELLTSTLQKEYDQYW